MVPLVVQYGHLLCVGKGVDGSCPMYLGVLDLHGASLHVLLQWLFLLHLVHQSSLFCLALQFLVL